VTKDELVEAFGAVGRVVDAKVPTDRETGRPRGFAFVEFESDEVAERCIQQMNGRDLKGRAIRVNAAEDRPPRPAGGGGGGYSRPGGGGFSRPGGGGGGFPPPEETGGGDNRGRRFKQKPESKPARKTSPRRRRDDVVDDDDADY
jgi:RNA recognition motif-containing protein